MFQLFTWLELCVVMAIILINKWFLSYLPCQYHVIYIIGYSCCYFIVLWNLSQYDHCYCLVINQLYSKFHFVFCLENYQINLLLWTLLMKSDNNKQNNCLFCFIFFFFSILFESSFTFPSGYERGRKKVSDKIDIKADGNEFLS